MACTQKSRLYAVFCIFRWEIDEIKALTRFYFGHHKCASQYIKGIMVQSAKLMGWKTKVDGISFVLSMGYNLRGPFVTILNNNVA